MSSFFKKIGAKVEKIGDKVEDGVMHARATAIGYINPNRRHDDPEEKQADEIRAEINQGHRFESFAGQRSNNIVKWHVDGHDYMWALSEMLDQAKETIFILDWWLTPELYLRRPPAAHPEWRLDRVLQRKAEQGVKIYIIVYKEVTQTMSMSSAHTKHVLERLHPNIACMRHPDHIGSKDDIEYWSHHEKVVVVDNHRACIGGLDLCFGRWDTHTHPLADAHPLDFSRTLFPGQDYNNARILDFQDVSNYLNNTLSILESPRMPWHDVHMTLFGDVVLDIVQHFTERWNEVKKRKYRKEERYDWLALPHKIEVAPNEAVARHPHREKWHEVGKRWKQHFHLEEGEEPDDGCTTDSPRGTCAVQAVRSVSDWSHGVLTEHSIQNAYCQMIREANHYIYIENQFFISNTQTDGPVKNQIAKALVERIIRAARDGIKFKVVVVFPEVPAFAGDVKAESSVQVIMAGQYRTINRGGHSIYEEIRKAGFEPLDYIRFYHLRAYDRIHAPMDSLLKRMTENSGVKFYEAQVALTRQWIGDNADTGEPGQKVPEEVTVTLPQPVGVDVVEGKKPEVKTEKIRIPKTEEEAKDIIQRFEHGATDFVEEKEVSDNVAQHMLEDGTSLAQEKWHGTEEEELNSYVSELLYIHSKLMIVDDRRVIMGSANLNDRSQKGDGDSEIALVVEDEDQVESTMDGRPYMAARFATTLRRKLYREHLGLLAPQWCTREAEVTSFMQPAPTPNENEMGTPEDNAVADPLSEETDRLWNETAKNNRDIFTEVFRPIPTNLVRDWKAYQDYVPKVKTGHVVPDMPLARVKERLSGIKGALVEMPLDFLIDQEDFAVNSTWSTFNPTLPVYI